MDAFSTLNGAFQIGWHADAGIKKGANLNKSIATTCMDYRSFIDSDVLIHPSFDHRPVQNEPSKGVYYRQSAVDAQNRDKNSNSCLYKEAVHFQQALAAISEQCRICPLGLKLLPFPQRAITVLERINPIRTSLSVGNAS